MAAKPAPKTALWTSIVCELCSRGWTLKTLGESIGLSYQQLSSIKRGVHQEPRGMAAVRLHRIHSNNVPPPQPTPRKARQPDRTEEAAA